MQIISAISFDFPPQNEGDEEMDDALDLGTWSFSWKFFVEVFCGGFSLKFFVEVFFSRRFLKSHRNSRKVNFWYFSRGETIVGHLGRETVVFPTFRALR